MVYVFVDGVGQSAAAAARRQAAAQAGRRFAALIDANSAALD